MVVEYTPPPSRPAKKYEVVSVPGRNGDLFFDQNAYDNYIQPYEVYIRGEKNGLHYSAHGVAEWLYLPKGYQRLEDDYDLSTYRLAYYVGPLNIEGVLNTYGRATLEFNCKPQRFLKSGETALPTFTSAGTLINPTGFPAKPLITITGSGSGALTIGAYSVGVSALSGSLTLDCEMQNAYTGTLNKNSTISAPAFPSLDAGISSVGFTGGITSVSIIPRWWRL